MTDLRRCQCRLAEFGEIESAQVFIYLRARQVGLRLTQKSPAVCALSSSEKVPFKGSNLGEGLGAETKVVVLFC